MFEGRCQNKKKKKKRKKIGGYGDAAALSPLGNAAEVVG